MASVQVPAQLKHYRVKNAELCRPPTLLFQVAVQFQDVRSGYRSALRACLQAEWLEEQDLDWTPDMVREVEPHLLEEIEPPRAVSWPPLSEQKIIQYMARHYRPRIWKNPELGVYSEPGESEKEFRARCRELLYGEWVREQQKFWDVFLHRFLELEQKLLDEVTREEEQQREYFNRRLETIRDVLFKVRESLSWLPECRRPLVVEDLKWEGPTDPAICDRVEDLRQELITVWNGIYAATEERATCIERYEVPVGYAQIEVVSRGLMWAPLVSPLPEKPS